MSHSTYFLFLAFLNRFTLGVNIIKSAEWLPATGGEAGDLSALSYAVEG